MGILELEQVTFRYGRGPWVLDGISFSAEKGDTVALVGPNGAGKSTLLRVIAALVPPAQGSLRIAGTPTYPDVSQCQAKLGYVSDSFGLHEEMTVREALAYGAGLKRITGNSARERCAELVREFELDAHAGSYVAMLSKGLRQRLGVALALVNRPEILLLDEPAAGLDPEARCMLSEMLKRLAASGTTIIVSSHILTELQDYATHLLVLAEGRCKTFEKIAREPNRFRYKLCVAEPLGEASASRLEQFAAEISMRGASEYEISFRGEPDAVLRHLLEAGARVVAFHPFTGLQERYFEKVGVGR